MADQNSSSHSAASWRGRVAGVCASIPLLSIGLPLVAPLMLVFLPLRAKPLPRRFWLLLGLGLLAVIGFIVSSVVHRVPLSQSSIGQTAMVLLVLAGGRSLIASPHALAKALTWFGVGMTVYFLVVRPVNTTGSFENLWKYGIGFPVALVLIGFLSGVTQRRWILSGVLLVLAVVGAAADFRSYALICAASAGVVLINGSRDPKKAARRALASVVSIVVIGFALLALVERGVFGSEVAARSARQFGSGPLGILLGGRTESPLAIAAIAQRPLAGWGTEQALTQSVVADGQALARLLGVADPAAVLPLWIRAGGRVSLHSVLLTSWVEGGVVSALFFIAVLIGLVAFLLKGSSIHSALLTLVCLQASWDLLFSPWSDNRGVFLGLVLLFGFSCFLWQDIDPSSTRAMQTKKVIFD